MATMNKRTVEDFFDTEYRAYALYTIENRALPSCVDGFKPAQRKIAFAANKLWRGGSADKPMKVFQLGGQAAALSFFHHGSLDQTIIGMTQDFKNSMPIFQGIGQFGSLRAPEAGAPRYVGVKFNDNFRRLYKDFDLTTPQYEEGEEIEPKFFLPIIPTVLLNGGSGVAVGFATNILNRHPLDLLDATAEYLQSGTVSSPLYPWVRGFNGSVEPVPDSGGRGWVFRGVYTVKNTSVVEVTEIPPSYTYEKYEAHLDSLVERGVIHAYEDSSSDRVRYVLRFPRAGLATLMEKDKLGDTLKMKESETENITTLDETGKLRVFNTAQELVAYFVKLRLSYYEKRKARLLHDLEHEISVLDGRVKFVQGVIKKKVSLADAPKAAIVEQVRALGISEQEGTYDYLLSMPIYSLTQEKIEDLKGKLREKTEERALVEKTAPADFYLSDLLELRKQLVAKGWTHPRPPTVKVKISTPPPSGTEPSSMDDILDVLDSLGSKT